MFFTPNWWKQLQYGQNEAFDMVVMASDVQFLMHTHQTVSKISLKTLVYADCIVSHIRIVLFSSPG